MDISYSVFQIDSNYGYKIVIDGQEVIIQDVDEAGNAFTTETSAIDEADGIVSSYIHSINDNILNQEKEKKVAELKQKCENAILAGFTSSNGHFYRTNRDDQTNFMGQKEELNDKPDMLVVPWKTEDVGYINHAREEWLTIFYEGLSHKKAQLYKYDTLKKQVESLTTIEEVQAIVW